MEQAKRETELQDLKKNIEEEARQHESAMGQLRTKHNNLVEDLNAQLDQFKRQKQALEKNKATMDGEQAEMAADIQKLGQQKSELERKNKNYEAQLSEANTERKNLGDHVSTLTVNLSKAQKEVDNLNVNIEDLEGR